MIKEMKEHTKTTILITRRLEENKKGITKKHVLKRNAVNNFD
jgi:hypothetical protein